MLKPFLKNLVSEDTLARLRKTCEDEDIFDNNLVGPRPMAVEVKDLSAFRVDNLIVVPTMFDGDQASSRVFAYAGFSHKGRVTLSLGLGESSAELYEYDTAYLQDRAILVLNDAYGNCKLQLIK